MSLIFISNLNHVLKKIKFIFNFKNKIKIKILHVAERYHFYDGVHHAQIKPYVICRKQLVFYKEIYINAEHKVLRKWVDKIWLGKILETGWKNSVVVEYVIPITDLKSYFTSLTQKRFQVSWENTN